MLVVLKAQQKQLDELIAEQKRTNELLARIAVGIEGQAALPGARTWTS